MRNRWWAWFLCIWMKYLFFWMITVYVHTILYGSELLSLNTWFFAISHFTYRIWVIMNSFFRNKHFYVLLENILSLCVRNVLQENSNKYIYNLLHSGVGKYTMIHIKHLVACLFFFLWFLSFLFAILSHEITSER